MAIYISLYLLVGCCKTRFNKKYATIRIMRSIKLALVLCYKTMVLHIRLSMILSAINKR